MTTLLVYVDDIIVIENDIKEQKVLKNNLAQNLEIKDLGPLKYFLGTEVAYSKVGIFLSQRKYILNLLKEIGLLGGKGACTLMEPNTKLGGDTSNPLVDKGRYQSVMNLGYGRGNCVNWGIASVVEFRNG